jgi:phospholipase/lecithinase/hemolysin
MVKTHTLCLSVILLILTLAPTLAQAQTPLVGMGDSLGEGVQSADADIWTQPNSYLNLVAQQMNVSFPLPWIIDGPLSNIFTVLGRFRLFPNSQAADLAVSGATVDSLLNQAAAQPVTNEADLVLEPGTGTQMQIAQSLKPSFTICWIGNTDALSAVIAWDELNGSQLTPVSQFAADYAQIATDLASTGAKVVVGTIPDVTQIGYLFSPQDLITFLGKDFGLPAGSYTTLPTMLLIKLGLNDGSLLQNPDYVLDAAVVATIQQQVAVYNQIIESNAATYGFAVADIHAAFEQLQQTPPVFYNVALTRQFNGGLFSLDGVHPSDIGHALVANVFIQAANTKFGMRIPQLTETQLTQIAAADPFIDWNGGLVVAGRPLAGLLETLGPFLGISGDLTNKPGSAEVTPAKIDKAAGQAFMREYLVRKGLPATTAWGPDDAIKAMKEVLTLWPRRTSGTDADVAR